MVVVVAAVAVAGVGVVAAVVAVVGVMLLAGKEQEMSEMEVESACQKDL